MGKSWTPDSWQNLTAAQQPGWEKSEEYSKVISEIMNYPPLVFAGEVRALKQQLADAARGDGFLIQGGDCAETFDDFRADSIRDKLKILLQMSVILTYGASCNVVKLGRIAGQFAKPRSSDTETRDGLELPLPRRDYRSRWPEPQGIDRGHRRRVRHFEGVPARSKSAWQRIHAAPNTR